jgi:large subunit ribosomal protein L21
MRKSIRLFTILAMALMMMLSFFFAGIMFVKADTNVEFGAIEGASVTANVVKNGKSAKVRVYKMKPKKGYRRTQGHRQPYTKVQIEAINA